MGIYIYIENPSVVTGLTSFSHKEQTYSCDDRWLGISVEAEHVQYTPEGFVAAILKKDGYTEPVTFPLVTGVFSFWPEPSAKFLHLGTVAEMYLWKHRLNNGWWNPVSNHDLRVFLLTEKHCPEGGELLGSWGKDKMAAFVQSFWSHPDFDNEAPMRGYSLAALKAVVEGILGRNCAWGINPEGMPVLIGRTLNLPEGWTLGGDFKQFVKLLKSI